MHKRSNYNVVGTVIESLVKWQSEQEHLKEKKK